MWVVIWSEYRAARLGLNLVKEGILAHSACLRTVNFDVTCLVGFADEFLVIAFFDDFDLNCS